MSTIRRSVTTVGSLYALMRQMLRLNVKTPLLTQEISVTSAPDRPLVVSTLIPIAGWPVDHGTVADEAAMLALHTLDSTTLLTEPTFVAPGDSVLRTDDPGWRWHCIAGHGQSLSDWERRPLGGALEGLSTSGHTHSISAITGLELALDEIGSGLTAVASELDGKADSSAVSAALNDDPTAGGESIIVAGPGGTLRRIVAGAGITLVATAGALTISADVSGSGEQPLGIVSEVMDYGTGPVTATTGGIGWSAPGGGSIVDYRHTSEVMDYGTGPVTATTGGIGWSGAGSFMILN